MLEHLALLAASHSASVPLADNPDLLFQAHIVSMSCVKAASTKGVDRSQFKQSAEWIVEADGSGMHHSSLPVTVTFPKDDDGISRGCVVQATLASQNDQTLFLKVFEVLLESKPVPDGDSMIWKLRTKKGRKDLEVFQDKTSAQPQIRVIGKAI